MNAPALGRRGKLAPASPIRRLAPYAVAAKARGITVHHLNIGQPDIPTPPAMIEAYQRFDDEVLAYAPSDGFADYREKLAHYYRGVVGDQPPVEPDDIMVTAGGSEALLFTIAAICDPEDEILVVEPFYTNYAGFSHLLSVRVKAVTTRAEDDFKLDPAVVADAVGPKTKALVLPNPGNPTGTVIRRPDLERLAAVCREHGLFFVCDEVYREFVYTGEELAPSALSLPNFDAHAVVIDSVSKRYSACGARIGNLVTRNKELRGAALRFGQARLSPPTVDQYAAMAALDTPASYFGEVRAEYQRRRDVVVAGLRRLGIQCATPEGAFYLVAPLPVDDAMAFCTFLLEDFDHDGETVMMAPAAGFYVTPGLGDDEVRIAYVLEADKLKRCITILEAALAAYAKR
ncbi:MAG: pyridoxal phosphate-dependent aminotransferase [Myxococcota bacterium]